MSRSPLARFSPDNIAAALKGFYTPPKPAGDIVQGSELQKMLSVLPSLSVNDHVDPILVQINRHHKSMSLNQADYATIAFVDDAVAQILRQTDLDFKIEAYIREMSPYIAATAVDKGVTSLTAPQTLLSLVDLILGQCVGWSEDLGTLGDQFMGKVEAIVRPFINGKSDATQCYKQLKAFFEKEGPMFKNREERLKEAELKVLSTQKGRHYATDMLNQQMKGKQFPLFIIFMLQGSWYEFLQAVFTRFGQNSKEWQDATRLSQALIWSVQAQKDIKKHRSLMSTLPRQIKKFCDRMPFDTTQVVASLADVEAEYEQIKSKSPSDPCDFDLLEVDPNMADAGTELKPDIRKTILGFGEGQWFLYDAPNEPDEKVARIKLILNWKETEWLLFTNFNRRKVMQMSYSQMAGHLSERSVRLLTPKGEAHVVIENHLVSAIHGVQEQKKKEVQIEKAEERKEISQKFQARRKEALVKSLAAHRHQAEAKRKRAEVLRHKADQKLEAAAAAVKGLSVDAWVKLPLMEGVLTACRLVAIIPAVDKYIFANRAGIKVAEYTGSQLSNMIVTENSEILDTGAEFANVLSSVVTGLREDRNKSYDELTGDVA